MNVSSVTLKAPTTDLGAITENRFKRNADKGTPAQKAAGQFEAIMVRQLLSQSVGKMLNGGSGGSETGSDVYGYMLTDAIAEKITQGGGLGLARMLEKQLTPKSAPAPAVTP